ncbi:MAG: ABC transporter permease subunit [Acidimicrobiia bacterium]|nr:ABC transporter permease subunit [Acidimicrobiia bacterium]
MRVRTAISFLGTIAVLIVLWEGYKAMGQATGGVWPGTSIDLPVRTNERSMPHSWDIVGSLFAPARRGGEDVLLVILVRAALWTWRSALIGFVVGSVVGFGLGVLFVRSLLAERGLMPYVVASQAVPVLAIAPIVVVWSGRLALPNWVPISVISAYLAFYPVAINTLRGLRSPEATSMELMRSYAASPGQVLWKLQIPASLPFLFPALKIAASASVIGAIVGELPAGFPQGLGRAILSFASSFSSAPEKLFASVLVSALLGLGFVGAVALVERLTVPAAMRVHEDAGMDALPSPQVAT